MSAKCYNIIDFDGNSINRYLPTRKTAIENASSVGTMFKNYERRAGIERQPFDGKGFHGLRRRLVKKLLVSGSSLAMVAQVLGQENTQSAPQYLVLDTGKLLKYCVYFAFLLSPFRMNSDRIAQTSRTTIPIRI